MQADLNAIIEAIQGTLVNEERIHDYVDFAVVASDPNEVPDDQSNVLLVTNLVHTQLMKVAAEVDIVAIVFTNGHIPKDKDKARASELELDLITTPLTLEKVHKTLGAEFGTTLEIRARLAPQ
jgi:hypothetical protein